jgi:hypothetical protein
MKVLPIFVPIAAFSLAQAGAASLEDTLVAFSARYEAAQPSDRQLSIWKLDWEDDLATALERAGEERRPVLFIHVTNITGPSNFGSGHC